MTWIEWFCSLKGNEGICIVPQNFIEDAFNLYGLKELNNYKSAYDVLTGEILDNKKIDEICDSVVTLYSLIHQRFIVTDIGLDLMRQKYDDHVFGYCPRYLCHGFPLLPIGISNEPRNCSVKYYCPCCKDIYTPPDDNGCFFGTSFPMEFLVHFPSYVPTEPLQVYKPKLYGFAIHKESKAYRKGRFLETSRKTLKSRSNYEDEDDV